jgi:hypothetical protein
LTKKIKDKKFTDVPGMISLLVIPVVLYILVKGLIIQPTVIALTLNLPPKDYFEILPEYNYRIGIDYQQINLTTQFSQEVEEYYLNLILELQKKNIDKTGIKFKLTDATTYEDLVRLLNLMEITEQPRYNWDIGDDNFYVIHVKEIEH